nr:unnamed protein product [Callosobruchus analis]
MHLRGHRRGLLQERPHQHPQGDTFGHRKTVSTNFFHFIYLFRTI